MFVFLEKEDHPRPLHLSDACSHFINGKTNAHTCGRLATRPHAWILVQPILHESWRVLAVFVCHVGLSWCVGIHPVVHTSFFTTRGAGVWAFSNSPTHQFSRTQRGWCVGVYHFAHTPVSSPTPKAVSCHVFLQGTWQLP